MTQKLKDELVGAAERVNKTGKRMPIRRKGRVIGAVVSPDDLKTLDEIDRMDLQAHRRALAEAKRKGENPLTLEEARRMWRV